jgi:hypothetical protein
MKAEPLGFMPPAPGQRSLDVLVSHWSRHVTWARIGSWLDRAITRLGEDEVP